MTIDIRTLVLVLGITHMIQVAVFYQQYKTNKSYQGIGWWLMWSIAEVAGFSGILLRGIPSIESIAMIIQNSGIFLGTIFIYIGMMRFLDKKVNLRIIFSISTIFIIGIAYFVYVDDNAFMRYMIFNVAVAGASLLTAYVLFVHKMPSITTSANFNVIIFLGHGGVFTYRAVMFLSGAPVDDFFRPTFFNYIPVLDALIVSLLLTYGFIIMINQRSNAEAREAKENLELTFNTSPDAVLVTRLLDGYFVNINDGFTELTGYTRAEVLGKSTLDINLWKNQADRQKLVTAMNEKGVCDNLEAVFQRKDGSQLTGIMYAKIITMQGLPYIISVTRDITERKRTEEALRESEERYRGVFAGTPDGMFVHDAEGCILDANEAMAQRLETPRRALLGRHIAEFITPESAANISANARITLAGQSNVFETTYVSASGKTIPAEVNERRIQWINGQAVLSISRDITARKQAEKALRYQHEMRQTILDSIPVMVAFLDCESHHQLVNRFWQSTLGWSLEEAQHSDVFAKLYPDPEYRKYVADYIAAAAGTWSDFKTRTRDERVLDTSWVNVPLSDGSTIGIGIDITERKQAEEEKQNLEERLSRAEKMEALGLLAGGVAHDLNNVLGIVVGYAELLLNDIDEKNPLRNDVVTIMDSGQRAATIVDDLLTLARRGVVGRKVLNLNNLIDDFKKSPDWDKLLSYHPNVKIKINLEPDLLNISGSSVHLVKTLYNLISNATEAMVKGGTITIKTTNQYIDKPISGYDTIREGDYVVLSVSDTGEGISKTDIKRIFEPFYTKKIMGRSGTGLGLSVVWGTVKDHHGYIDVQSEEGKGTTVTLYFLITREDLTTETSSVSMSEYMGKGQSILVVDDVKEQRDLASRMLKSLNYNVASASSGEDAVGYLKEHKIDLLVLDMIMDPGMDGLDTYQSVRKINPKQKAIIVSGFSESKRVKATQKLGAGAYVKKPYIKEKLGLAVKKELGGKKG